MTMYRHQESAEHWHRFARLKTALRAMSGSSSEAMALVSRLSRCNGPDWGYRFTCRSPACPSCRDRYIGSQRRKAEVRFAGAANSEMAMLSINLGETRAVAGVDGIMAKARRDLRNLFDRQRTTCDLWRSVEVLAWMEMDAFDLEDYPRLGPDKREQFSQFLQAPYGSKGVVWCPHLHGVIRIVPGLDLHTIRTAIENQWTGHRRVDVRPFSETKNMVTNLGDIINYSLKHECTTEYYAPETGEVTTVEWETRWLGEYYSWLYGWSRGFQSTRLLINPKNERWSGQSYDCDPDEIYTDHLPIDCSFSVFPMDYYYW
jgi:hypothetical protein